VLVGVVGDGGGDGAVGAQRDRFGVEASLAGEAGTLIGGRLCALGLGLELLRGGAAHGGVDRQARAGAGQRLPHVHDVGVARTDLTGRDGCRAAPFI
jgi:hypothetical protein